MSEKTNLSKKFPLSEGMRIKQSTCLDKSMFISSNIRLIGQTHNQMIICLLIKQNLLLALDQHAIHERIRFESLLSGAYRQNNNNNNRKQLITRSVIPPYRIPMPKDICQRLIDNNEEILNRTEQVLGLKLSVQQNNKNNNNNEEMSSLLLKRVPICFKDFEHPGLFQDFMIDVLKNFDSGKLVEHSPMIHFLLEQIRTQACRGAIRFNESLTYQECHQLIRTLTKCKTPFRCAHGRVLVKPLIYIIHNEDKVTNKRKELFDQEFPNVEQQIKKCTKKSRRFKK